MDGCVDVSQIVFDEKAMFACPLPMKRLLEFGRWNPVSLLMLAPLWSYKVAGSADHWLFVARCANKQYYYAAQFFIRDGESHVAAVVCKGLPSAVNDGLQYSGSTWWTSM